MKKRLISLLLALVLMLALLPTADAVDASSTRLERIDLNMNAEWKAECNSGYSCIQVHNMLKTNKVYQVADTTDSNFNITILGLYARCHIKADSYTATKNLWFPGSDSLLAEHPFANSSLDYIPNATDYEEFGVVLKVTWGSGYTVNQSKLPSLYINGKKTSLGTCDRDFYMCSDKSIGWGNSTTAYLWFDIVPGKPTANTSGIASMTLELEHDGHALKNKGESYLYKGVTVTYHVTREGINADQVDLEWRLSNAGVQSTRIIAGDNDSVTVQIPPHEPNEVLGLYATSTTVNKYTGERFHYEILLRLGSAEEGVKRLEASGGVSIQGISYVKEYPFIRVQVRNKGLWLGSRALNYTISGNTRPIKLKEKTISDYNTLIYTEYYFEVDKAESSKNITFTFTAADDPSVQTVWRTSWGKYGVWLYKSEGDLSHDYVYGMGRYATDTIPECDFVSDRLFKGWYIRDSAGKPWVEKGLFYPGDMDTYASNVSFIAASWDVSPIAKQPVDQACLPFGGNPDMQVVALNTDVVDPTQVKEVFLERYDETEDRWGKVTDATTMICTQESMYTKGVSDWKNSTKRQAVFYSKSEAIVGFPQGTVHVFFSALLANTGKYRVKFVLNDGSKVLTRRFTEEFGGEIQHIRLQDMVLPALGQTAYGLGGTPTMTIDGVSGSGTIALAEPSYFSSAYLAWYDKSSGRAVSGTFTPGNEYYYRLTLTAADGYSLPEGYDSSCYARDFFQVAYLDERIDKPEYAAADVAYTSGDYLYHRMTDLCNVFYLSDTLFIESPTYTCQSTGDLICRINIRDLAAPVAGDTLVAQLNRGFQKENETARFTADYGGTGRLAASPIESYYVSWTQPGGSTSVNVQAGQQRYAYIVINFKYGFTPALKNENEFDGDIIFNDGDGTFALSPTGGTKLSSQGGSKWKLIIRTEPVTIQAPNAKEVEGLVTDESLFPGGLAGVARAAMIKLGLMQKVLDKSLEYTWDYMYQSENGAREYANLTTSDTNAPNYRLPENLRLGGQIRCMVFDPEDKQTYISDWVTMEPCVLSVTAVDGDNGGAAPENPAAVLLTGSGIYNEGMEYILLPGEDSARQEINPGTYSVRVMCEGYRDQLLGVVTFAVGEESLDFTLTHCPVQLQTTRIVAPVDKNFYGKIQVTGKEDVSAGIVYHWNGDNTNFAGLTLNATTASVSGTPTEPGTYTTLLCLYEGEAKSENLLLGRYITVVVQEEGALEEIEILNGPFVGETGTTTMTLSYTPGLEEVTRVIAARKQDGKMTDVAFGTLEGSMHTFVIFEETDLTTGDWELYLLKAGFAPMCQVLIIPEG